MATGLSATDANTALDAALAGYTWIKLHVGDPGSAGTANPATETTRKQATWRASTAGASSNSNTLTWTSVAGSETYSHFTAWSASTAGTFGFSGTITTTAISATNTFVVVADGLAVAFTVAS